jgi:hypothetical protein
MHVRVCMGLLLQRLCVCVCLCTCLCVCVCLLVCVCVCVCVLDAYTHTALKHRRKHTWTPNGAKIQPTCQRNHVLPVQCMCLRMYERTAIRPQWVRVKCTLGAHVFESMSQTASAVLLVCDVFQHHANRSARQSALMCVCSRPMQSRWMQSAVRVCLHPTTAYPQYTRSSNKCDVEFCVHSRTCMYASELQEMYVCTYLSRVTCVHICTYASVHP